MKAIKVSAEVDVYEVDGEERIAGTEPLKLKSHWNRDNMVVIELPAGGEITLAASELCDAVKRCSR